MTRSGNGHARERETDQFEPNEMGGGGRGSYTQRTDHAVQDLLGSSRGITVVDPKRGGHRSLERNEQTVRECSQEKMSRQGKLKV